MIIELANVGTIAKKIVIQFDPSEIDLDGEAVLLTDKASLVGEMFRSERGAQLDGHLNGTLSLDCTRCVEPMAKTLDLDFRAIFVDASSPNAAEEHEVKEEALDESFVEDGRIDLAEVVREQILLALPEQIFCREDCLGLCPKCGANLNLIDCSCASDEVDPRWAALKSLK